MRAFPCARVRSAFAVVVLAAMGCTGTVGDVPLRGSTDGPGNRPVPGLPPDAPTFLELSDEAPRLLHLTPTQLSDHIGDVLGIDLALQDSFPVWSAEGELLEQERFTAMFGAVDTIQRAAAGAGRPVFGECGGDRACLAEATQRVGGALARRPLSSAEVDAYLSVYDTWADGADAERGLLTSLVLSPYVTTQHDRFRDSESHRALVLFQTPSTSMPDDPIQDPRFERHVRSLVRHWLDVEEPMRLERTLESGETVDRAARERLFDELVRDVTQVFRDGGHVGDLFSYGEDGLGILGAPYVLLSHSATNHRSIVFRGLFVFRELLCQSIAFPSGAIQDQIEDFMNENRGSTEIDTMNRRHAIDTCRSCHSVFDGFGLRLNDFNMVGERAPQSDQTANVAARIPGWQEPPSLVEENSPEALAAALRTSSVARACFARRWAELLVDGDLGSLDAEAYGALIDATVSGTPLTQVLMTYVDGLGPARSE